MLEGFVLLLTCCAQVDSMHMQVLYTQRAAIVEGRLIAAFLSCGCLKGTKNVPDLMSCRCVSSGLYKQLHAKVCAVVCSFLGRRGCGAAAFCDAGALAGRTTPCMYCDVCHACSSSGTAAPAERTSCQGPYGTCLPRAGRCAGQRLYIACCFTLELLCAA